MTLVESIKPFWPLLFTFVLPRAITYYRELRTAVRTRPPPRELSPKSSRSLNVLFVSICIFLWLSLTANSANDGLSNVFSTTHTRLGVPGELLFARLALRRPNGNLSSRDEDLRSKFTSTPIRQIYLRVGPEPILNCPFCQPDDSTSYVLHALPTQILFPHLMHLLLLGLATSKSFSGAVAATFRFRAAFVAIALFIIDNYFMLVHEFRLDTQNPAPFSPYAAAAIYRPIAFCIVDVGIALLIYATATNRFIFFPFLASASEAAGDPDELVQQTKTLLHESGNTIQMALMKLRGVNVTQNTVRRDEHLKGAEDEYWMTVRDMEGRNGPGYVDPTVFEDEEVQAAVARAFGSGNIDVAGMRREAETFVREMTRPLDQPREQTRPPVSP